jgi:peptidoglycan-associated lipoprotein
MLSRLLPLTLLLAASISITGCVKGHKAGAGSGSGADGDYVNGTPLPDRQEGVSFLGSNVDRNKFSPVHFAFDSYNVSANEQGKIQEVAGFLRSSNSTVIVAGFTDERGTPEYNRGLGERRAQAVREALIHAGADGQKIQTVSFGAEMPADPGSGESAWAKNRRAEFGVVR